MKYYAEDAADREDQPPVRLGHDAPEYGFEWPINGANLQEGDDGNDYTN